MSEDIAPVDQPDGAISVDALGRTARSLRLSVTDRCNLRCGYCMPEVSYTWLPKAELLDFDEISQVVDGFIAIGTRRLRLTGGEPLLRRDVDKLVQLLGAKRDLEEIALTTNGLLLASQAAELARAGLSRITISLDTLRPARFAKLTRKDALSDVLAGIEAVRSTRLKANLKIDCVALRDTNTDEIVDMVRFAQDNDAEIRFIEYMDVGGATHWRPDAVLTANEILERISAELGTPTALEGRGAAPAQRYALPDGSTFGIIASVTAPFCGACDRSRITADGMWLHCLYATTGMDLKTYLRTNQDLVPVIADAWTKRDARGAEERAALPTRSPLVPVESLRRNPHLEMHKRGG